MQDLSSEVSLKSLGEGDRPISPAALAGLLSTLLYSRRGSPFFVEPIVAGLDSRGKPYLCGQVGLLASWFSAGLWGVCSVVAALIYTTYFIYAFFSVA